MDTLQELERLNELRKSGAISDEEYDLLKQKVLSAEKPEPEKGPEENAEKEDPPILSETPPPSLSEDTTGKQWDEGLNHETTQEERTWGLILHLSTFAGYLIFLAGLLAPVLIWVIKKDESPFLNENGKVVMNFIFTELLIGVLGFITLPIIIGFFILVAAAIMGIVFPIIGGIKAHEGKVWKYPVMIEFFKLNQNRA